METIVCFSTQKKQFISSVQVQKLGKTFSLGKKWKIWIFVNLLRIFFTNASERFVWYLGMCFFHCPSSSVLEKQYHSGKVSTKTHRSVIPTMSEYQKAQLVFFPWSLFIFLRKYEFQIFHLDLNRNNCIDKRVFSWNIIGYVLCLRILKDE